MYGGCVLSPHGLLILSYIFLFVILGVSSIETKLRKTFVKGFVFTVSGIQNI